jgi:hypothetical protein
VSGSHSRTVPSSPAEAGRPAPPARGAGGQRPHRAGAAGEFGGKTGGVHRVFGLFDQPCARGVAGVAAVGGCDDHPGVGEEPPLSSVPAEAVGQPGRPCAGDAGARRARPHEREPAARGRLGRRELRSQVRDDVGEVRAAPFGLGGEPPDRLVGKV